MDQRGIVPLLMLLGAGGCGYYGPALLQPGLDAASGAGAGSGGEAGGVCQHASPPAPPPTKDAGGSLDLVFAMRTIQIGVEPDAGASLGYDLDKTCTCQGEGTSCMEPAWATADHCDGHMGRDNAAGRFLAQMALFIPAYETATLTEQLEQGEWGVLIRIRDYNGLPDDDQVDVSWYLPDPLVDNGDAGLQRPKWDGCDTWSVRDANLEVPEAGPWDIDQPKCRDRRAYVSGGMVVGQLAHGAVQASQTLRIELTDPYLTMELVQTDTGWEMRSGVLAGVWTLEDLFKQMGYTNFSGIPLCTGSQGYELVKPIICSFADIYRTRGSPASVCDSLSFAMGFTASQARLGAVTPSSSTPAQCDAEHDPANDSCDQ